jgi:EAL domain-containing protein (putative c-di-GMP-specific phosphodiesterase class I)
VVPKRLAAIDDDPKICAFIKKVAEGLGYSVFTTSNGEEFLSEIQHAKPTLALLDYAMPTENCAEILRAIGNQGTRSPIVLMSSIDARILRVAQRLGENSGLKMAGILHKPILLNDLKVLLGNVDTTEEPSGKEMREAIDKRELVLHFQPIVHLNGSKPWKIHYLEALVRWQHPTLGLLQPDTFLPVVEREGLFWKLTHIVLSMALEHLKEWHKENLTPPVAINLPAQMLTDLSFPDEIAEIVNAYGIESHHLFLEVTETGAMEDAVRALDVLTRFRLKGFALSMDDFGTGYSSLLQLYRMPFSQLKIDRSFIQDAGSDEEARAIVRASTDLAHNLELTVCAEGVENAAALQFLTELGVDTAQGYYICRPAPADKLAEIMLKWQDDPNLLGSGPIN